MDARPLTGSIGAELHGVDLAEVARDDERFAELKALLLEHKVLFFRNQEMSRAEHVALAERFGSLEDHPVLGSDPEHPGLIRIYKDLDSPPEAFENSYHCDATWRENPPMGSVLRCVEGPAVGGDTIWVNMALAYEQLPSHVKEQIAGLRARHSIEASFGARLPIDERLALKDRFPDAEHPVVRTHPETGEKVLFVNSFTTHFTNFHTADNVRCGIDYAPGAGELLRYLQSRATIPEYQVRWRWTPNSVAIWDNRSTQHYAVQDYWPAVRRMERAGIAGDRPF
ncbi:TauD/TfdA dioxygenase family protein [Rhodococcus rhodochrous]|uniref:TauD/TfdA family dioxygenase n=2 Tax=Rhodococcus rhodochrous TaxID=1829 RepID=A0AA46WZW6_RHORH|nr:TauD/TfdA family dioxygenase [Rhodococcus rhodochrous]AYA27789.1 taurine dioxygenase [Rhodococcus rhodochrous]MBF4478491.1 TauD/TfdA family dioxygenase [Rhodococcus rhodochrous]MCB8913019.1 TauD/TfdA family dioxygenase [Rhodococcus rhodochrous]UZF47516.1 TauD/TfdA family dioxygenase [Rhodococcus rhodochrous]